LSRTESSTAKIPVFPEFRPLRLEDRRLFHNFLWDYQPETSELTFTNLFIWQEHYGYEWSLDRDWLLVVAASPEHGGWALPPLGPPSRVEVTWRLLVWLAESGAPSPRLERADQRLVDELGGSHGFSPEPVRDHFDYLYRSRDLIDLHGGKYHSKRNYVNSLERSLDWRYEALEARHLPACRELAADWCRFKRCQDDLSLMGEWGAVAAALANFTPLNLTGGVIFIDGKLEAFSLGELLNRETAVIHVEKANPEIRGLYALINQQFAQNAWAGVPFINREQDLGEPNLRSAKLSYHPHRLVEKFTVRPA
jgi:hypothetical protein